MKKYNVKKTIKSTDGRLKIRYNMFTSVDNSNIGYFYPQYIIFLYFPCIYDPGYLATAKINIETKFFNSIITTCLVETN